ncbi:MAG: RNA-binding protein [Dehalococcoidia bacterium]|nr:RNA-binding protein [Dehalococcoidia bacterium]
MKIYVGNLPRELSEDDLRREFEAFGKVESVAIVKDRYGGQSRGFGFVEMPTKSEATAAITGLKGKVLQERTLDVSEARPRPAGGRSGPQFRGGKGGGRGGFGGGKGRRY